MHNNTRGGDGERTRVERFKTNVVCDGDSLFYWGLAVTVVVLE